MARAVPWFLIPAALGAAVITGPEDKPADPAARKEQLLRRFADEFVVLKPGTDPFPASFEMGSRGDLPAREQPAHAVRLSGRFAVARYEVTQELYEAVTGGNPSRWKGPRNSVEMVSWAEARDFCAKATAELRRLKLLGDDELVRLPSEAEWEYACRAGTTTLYCFGDRADDLKDYAWFKGNSKGEDPPVGKKKPNAWGLYDMHGYVWEWCADAWHGDYKGAPADGSAWDEKDARERVVRGGSWADAADQARSAARDRRAADHRGDNVGFRCVRAAKADKGGADWPQFLGPDRNGTSAETGLLRSWDKKGPPLLWERAAGEGYSGPVVAGDAVVLLHRVGDEEVVEALDAATGKGRWKVASPTRYRDDFGKGDGPRSTPAVSGGRVYALGAEGRLLCLELAGGKKLWERALAEDYPPARKGFFGVGTSPLVEGDLVLVNAGGKGAGIVAFHKDTGKEAWKATDDEASYASPVAATVGGTRHAFFFTRAGLVSLDPATGRVRFTKPWRSRAHASVNAASPVVVGDHLFLSACYDTGAVLLRVKDDGVEEVWKGDDILSNHYGTSIHHAGHLYGFDGRQEEKARLRCVELKTGKVRWTQEGHNCGSMILADGHLIVVNEDGELCLVEATPEGYREKGRAPILTKPCRAQIALADGRLFARDAAKLYCWNLKR